MPTQGRILRNLLLAPLLLLPLCVIAQDRYALVIGNGRYTDIDPLRNPPHDVRLVSKALRDVNFDVKLLQDADYRTMREAVNDFAQKLDDAGKAAVGVFYFAGHGISLDGQNWLIPIGAAVKSPSDIRYGTLSANYVQDRLETARNLTDIIILDACRNNPFASRGINLFDTRSATNGMGRMESKGSYIALSTSPGAVAYDGEGDYSPFAEAFAIEVGTPGLTIDDMMTSVRRRVQEATMSRGEVKQRPWSQTSMSGHFYFNPASKGNGSASVSTNAAIVTPQPIRKPGKSPEDLLWDRVKSGNSIDDYEFYLEEYPSGQYASVARYEKRQLSRKKEESQQAQKSNGGTNNSGQSSTNVTQQQQANTVNNPPVQNSLPQTGRGMPQQGGQTAVWYDNEFIEWAAQVNGIYFTASTFYPGMGQISLQGQFDGYLVSYGIYDAMGNQVGYGQ